MFPTIERIEDYIESLEDAVYASLSAASPELPNVRETFNRLWDDVSRFGPVLSDIHVPSLGDFQVPPPPPPPPPPKSFWEISADWCSENPWKVVGISVGAVGAGLLVGYATHRVGRGARYKKAKGVSVSNERRQVVVVLGGDRPLGLSLILDLEKKGYIVIAGVSTSEAVDELERKTHGYVKALVLDPSDSATVPIFLRSLVSTLSHRFPLKASGDPHTLPSCQPYIHSVISLLTLSSSLQLPPAPLEHLPLESTYLPYLQSTHVTPLQVIQALLPLLRTSPARAKDALSNNKGKQSIIVCLPATDTRVGLPFASAQAMSASATLQGIQILRREIKISALSAAGSYSMKNLRVVTVDVGSIQSPGHAGEGVGPSIIDVEKALQDWTPSEKAAYGPSLISISEQGGHFSRSARKPTEISTFVNTIVDIVGGERACRGASRFVLGVGLLRRVRSWIRGDRISVGAGAGTYSFASNLPSFMLDALINLPHFLISVRDALLPVPPPRSIPPGQAPPGVVTRPHAPPQTLTQPPGLVQSDSPITADHEEQIDPSSETGSEVDIESNAGDTSAVDSSWVSLREGF